MNLNREHALLLTRRQFFGRTAAGVGTAALASLLNPQLFSGVAAAASSGAPAMGGVLKALHRAPSAKRVIFMFMSGGPSHIDLFDYKPRLRELHGTELPGSVRMGQRITGMTSGQKSFPCVAPMFQFAQHGRNGAWVSELLPHTAKVVDDIAVIKSMHTEQINHDPATTFLVTGHQQPGRPSMGAWLSYGLGSENHNLPAFLVCAILAMLLIVGVSESAKVNNVIVAVKVTVLTAFIVVGGAIILANMDQFAPNWQPFIPENTGKDGEFGWSGIIRAASIVFFAYIGFEAVSTAGQEAKNPEKDMPFGIIGSLIACTVIYILVSIVMTLIVPYNQLNVPDPVAVAVDAFGPQWAWFASTIKVGAIIGLTSVILVLMYGQTRIFYTMARDGLLPKVFARVHPRFRTPWVNTIVVGLLTASAAAFFDINTLGDMTSVGTLAAFGIVCMAVMWLRRTHPNIPRGFHVPLYPILPIAGVISCFALIFTVETRVLVFFAWYAIGAIVLYFLYGMHNSRLAKGLPVMGGPEMPEFKEDAPDRA